MWIKERVGYSLLAALTLVGSNACFSSASRATNVVEPLFSVSVKGDNTVDRVEANDMCGLQVPNELNPGTDELLPKHSLSSDANDFLKSLTASDEEYEYYANKEVVFDYDGYERTESTNDFLSRGERTFEGINGANVTTHLYYGTSYCRADQPNVGLGLLLYKAIRYKLAYPDLENEISISSFRYSIIAGINLLKSSPYYGLMKSMPDDAMDRDGFVRFSYLVLFAAKIGIHVNLIQQIEAYSDYGTEILAEDYYPLYLDEPCSAAHGLGDKKIGDFLHYKQCKWVSYEGKSATDMYHIKCLAAEHYLDDEDQPHDYALFTSSANLDGINKNGSAGNTGSQTGLLVLNHEYLYLAARNFIKFSQAYCDQDDVHDFRVAFKRVIAEQRSTILSEGYAGMKDSMMVYLGTESDKVFELSFAPFDTDFTSWNTTNPFCKYVDKLSKSKSHIKFYATNPKFDYGFDFLNVFFQRLSKAYKVVRAKEEIDKNALFISSASEPPKCIESLEVGKHLGKKGIRQNNNHQKDMYFEYEEDGKRCSAILFSTLNWHMGAFFYQANSALVVRENEDTGFDLSNEFRTLYNTYEIYAPWD